MDRVIMYLFSILSLTVVSTVHRCILFLGMFSILVSQQCQLCARVHCLHSGFS